MSPFPHLCQEITLPVFIESLLTRVLPHLNETNQRRIEELRNINHKRIDIFEGYGCAVIYSDASYGVSQLPQIAITMIALDSWKFSCYRRKDLNFVMTSSCEKSSYLSVGKIDADQLEDYLARFRDQLKRVTGKPGHQRTPGFIYSILQCAIAPDFSAFRPCPGFTDVGQHSGQVPPRDTKWSLVQMITKHHLGMADSTLRVKCLLHSLPAHTF